MSEHGTIGPRKYFETPLTRKKKGEQGEMQKNVEIKRKIESMSYTSSFKLQKSLKI